LQKQNPKWTLQKKTTLKTETMFAQILLFTLVLNLPSKALDSTKTTAIYGVETSEVQKDDFCSGWKDGYINGWCYGDRFCIPPIVPICPVPRIGESTYTDGYNRGFIVGKGAREHRGH
jgi:hypothetical protein